MRRTAIIGIVVLSHGAFISRGSARPENTCGADPPNRSVCRSSARAAAPPWGSPVDEPLLQQGVPRDSGL